MKLFFATSSKNKFEEASQVFPDLERIDVDLPEIQSADPLEIVTAKLNAAVAQGRDRVLVDDTGLDLECLGGLPGPFIKFFIVRLGAAGLFEIAKKIGNIRAVAKTVVGCSVGGRVFIAHGEVSGQLVAPRSAPGTTGFGFDPIFTPDGSDKTYAEMSLETKASLDHRSRAMCNLRSALEQAFGK